MRVGLAAVWLAAGVGAGVLSGAGAEVVVLKGGAKIELASPMVVKGDRYVLTRADGTVLSVPISEVDLEATRALKAAAPQATPAPTPPPARPVDAVRPARAGDASRTRITDENLRHASEASASPARSEIAADPDPCRTLSLEVQRLRDLRGATVPEELAVRAKVDDAGLACSKWRCDRGNVDGCETAATILYESGKAAESRAYVEKSCRLGRKMSCDALQAVRPLQQKMDEIDTQEEDRCRSAASAATPAVRASMARSCVFAGTLQFQDGVFDRAGDDFRRACDVGDGRGCADLALVQHKLGRDSDVVALMAKACGLGFTSACHRNIQTVDQPW
jgi:hypothetical protein